MAPQDPTSVELVVTVPGAHGTELISRLGLRTTLGVLTELLASAHQSVVIAAPFIQGAEGLHAGPLGMALTAAVRRGVAVDVISTGASLSALLLDPSRLYPDHACAPCVQGRIWTMRECWGRTRNSFSVMGNTRTSAAPT